MQVCRTHDTCSKPAIRRAPKTTIHVLQVLASCGLRYQAFHTRPQSAAVQSQQHTHSEAPTIVPTTTVSIIASGGPSGGNSGAAAVTLPPLSVRAQGMVFPVIRSDFDSPRVVA